MTQKVSLDIVKRFKELNPNITHKIRKVSKEMRAVYRKHYYNKHLKSIHLPGYWLKIQEERNNERKRRSDQ